MKRLGGLISAAAFVFTVGCAQTDSGITTNVKAKFATDDIVKASDIDIDTKDHIVTLSGVVASETAKHRAVEIASTTGGVRDVIDRMTVRDTAATTGTVDAPDVDLGADARRGGEVLKHGAEQTGDAIKDAAEDVGHAVKKGAEKVGDAVTDDDRDSDKDGK
jgi:hypothetical protein